MTNKEKSLEQWCRRQLLKKDVRLTKSRKHLHINNLGGYQLVELYTNTVLDGSNYDLSIEDVKWRIENFEDFYEKN